MNLESTVEASGRLRKADDALRQSGLGITVQQATVLWHLRTHPDPTSGSLARLLGVTPAVVTGMVDRLERAGCVERYRSTDDRRVVSLHVTPVGLDRLRAVETALREAA